MEFPKANQQMLLLLSEKNPMWRVLLDPQPLTQENIYRITRKGRSVLATWRHSAVVKATTCAEVFDCINARIDWDGKPEKIRVGKDELSLKGFKVLTDDERAEWTAILADYKQECAKGDDSKAYTLAHILKLGIEDCQKIIDGLIYESRPLFPSFYYGADVKERARSKKDFDAIEGFYHLWARRGDVWLKAAVRVRYDLKMRGGSAIRVKMNFPLFDPPNPKRPYEEYDGFVVTHARAPRLYWVFEERKELEGDYWYMITTSPYIQQNHNGVLAGTYLSTGQDIPMRSIVSSDVVLIRQPRLEIKAVADLMHTTARVVKKGDPEWEVPEEAVAGRRVSIPV